LPGLVIYDVNFDYHVPSKLWLVKKNDKNLLTSEMKFDRQYRYESIPGMEPGSPDLKSKALLIQLTGRLLVQRKKKKSNDFYKSMK
jgi:hypothetical protein